MNKTFCKLIMAGSLIVLVTVLSLCLWNRQPEEGSPLNDMEEDIVEQSESEKDTLTGLNDEKEDEIPKGQMEQLVVGEDYFLVLYDDGTVWSWGNNAEGKLGIAEEFISEPQKIKGLEGVVKLEDGGCNVFALTDQGSVYTWGREWYFVSRYPDYDNFLYAPKKVRNLRDIVNITAKNDKLYVTNSQGELLYVPDYNYWELNFWEKEQTEGLFRNTDSMYAGTGNYDYFVRTDGTVFSIMRFFYEGYGSNDYAFIFPHVGDVVLEKEDLITPRTPDELPEITVLALGGKYDYLIYYDLTGVDNIDIAGSDPYTVFLGKEDGTLHYWNSDRIKYHDNEFFLTQPETQRERCEGNFEEVSVADVLGLDNDVSEIPRVVSIQPAMENTLFLTDDGQVFVSGYETYETSDVTYGLWEVPNPGRDSLVATYHNAPLKELVFQKLELTDIASIWTNGENCFCAVDREGGYHRIVINDNEVTLVDQGMLP